MACHGNASGLSNYCLCSDNGKYVCYMSVQAGRSCFSCVPLRRGCCLNCGGANKASDGSITSETNQNSGSVDSSQFNLDTSPAASSQVD